MSQIEETTEQARQGERKGWISRVLIISTGLAVLLMIASYILTV